METLPVTLIVKAPNQQFEDQTVQCESSWTINKLKQHLSEVYPSKPPKHEQKLIYSGQLLSDSVTLKDILRQYEGQETHTVHLVCSPRHCSAYKAETSQNVDNAPTNVTTQTQERSENSVPQPNTNISWPNEVPTDMNQYLMQLAWMQQAYLQYMSQYMQLAANSYANGVPLPNHNGAQAQPNPVEPPAPAQPAPEHRDPENPERDWLDIFYTFSRIMVLFSVVYFYSSPLRFIVVLFLGFGLYLYQIGFFRNANHNNNNNNNTVNADPAAPPVEQAPSRLMIVWTFLTTFIASLIPEIPNAV